MQDYLLCEVITLAYGTYADYVETCGADLSEEEYLRVVTRATAMLDTFTGRRSQKATGYKLEAVKRAECELVRSIASATEKQLGSGVTSVSNEGYSESYVASTPEAVDMIYRQSMMRWLSGTGLVGAL